MIVLIEQGAIAGQVKLAILLFIDYVSIKGKLEVAMEGDYYGLAYRNILRWMALIQCPRFGIKQLNFLLGVLPCVLQIFHLTREERSLYKFSPVQLDFLDNVNWHSLEIQLDWCIENQIAIIPYVHPNYPDLLKQTNRPPIVLFARGMLEVLDQVQIGFVGSRTPSPYGVRAAEEIVMQLSQTNFAITSGMAIGIDGVVHKAALANGSNTIAVMGAGFRHVYPKRHMSLAMDICNQGVLISEFLPDVPPVQTNFPRRNRIIAGLSNGVVVVEAAVKSGSLITAKYALEEGRDVFAIPGNIFNPLSQGCHHLLQQGAKLVCNADDIVDEYTAITITSQIEQKKNLAEPELLASVDHDTTPVDVIIQRSNLPVEQVLMELLELEVQGLVAAVPGGFIRNT